MHSVNALLIIILLLLAGCSQSSKENNQTSISFTQFSASVGDTFYVNVQLPKAYFEHTDSAYPVVLLTDANFFFPMISAVAAQYEMAGLMEPAIIVGIGYKSFKTMDSLRVRDYLYPEAMPSDEINAPGGGQRFFDFITQELIPKIDSEYRTQEHNRALLGHSFGGYFVLYSLLQQLENNTHTFTSFVSVSPSLWYNDFFLEKIPDALKNTTTHLNLITAVGSLEDSTWSINPVVDLAAQIRKQNSPSLAFTSIVYPRFDHMDTAVPTFTKALKEFLKK